MIGYLILVLFTHYLVCHLQTKQAGISLKLLYIMGIMMLVAVGLVVISQFNGMYYLIGERNMYHRQDWFWLLQMFGISGIFLNGTLLFRCRKSLNRKELCAFGIYILLPGTGEQQSTSHALEHFAYYLRGNMDYLSCAELIPFAQEVSHVRDYLHLDKIRFEDKLNIVCELTATDFMRRPSPSSPFWKMPCATASRRKKAAAYSS